MCSTRLTFEDIHGEVKEGPYNGFEILNFRGRQKLQDQSDVFNILHDSPHLSSELDELTFKYHENGPLGRNLQWRADLLGIKRGFCNDVQSDLPWQLDEGIRSNFSKIEVTKGSLAPEIGQQMLSRHPFYSNAVLVRDYFRCFPRDDGFLLTTSPTVGLNYLDRYFARYVEVPSHAETVHQDHSALENIRRGWELDGTASWEIKLVHWLMVLLVNELEVAPHNHRLWKNVPDIQNAYLPIVRDLKHRRASRFRRHESVNLVREYVSCMDEISQINEISMQKIEFLGKLREHCKSLKLARLHHILGSINEKSLLVQRVDEAVKQIEKDNENLPRLINDLKTSLDVLFQLRTIEQNELAIIAESNNKAILVFTVVIFIFLPLSFFTSYFGMNLQGIANTDKTQGYFWAVCGSVTLFVVSFTVV
ncbi:hypothetical protein HO173_011646 [Letharia columbiana]|uniref:Mg2+ transporter protein n=1 Tax=Letharia columbiana TaxID=112416 RepID=A0A8H6FI02_9LECA|nr:uncharacterized protein HO173_011646 [Letharia columbiana]KAF6228798.1 hypothetical protein HO173_011646 [Letharia columbiana]